MSILLGVSSACLAGLLWERIALDRRLKRVPLRICITGTRGKSSVARMLASVLRRSGRTVLAKTTGSEARYVLPDGDERDVPRRGAVSILEQKRLVTLAARLRADCLVAEIMSLRPEAHRVEAQLLLRPHILAVTNVRPDHTDVMGESRADIATVLASTVCRGTAVFLTEDAPRGPFLARVRRHAGRLLDVPPGAAAELCSAAPELGRAEFAENLDLVCAIARHLGIPDETILAGMRETRHDAGRLRISLYRAPDSPRIVYLVNAFAANDPESTSRVLSKVKHLLPAAAGNVIGVLNLRDDRVPRTLQWVNALNGPAAGWFSRIFLAGTYPPAITRRLPSAVPLEHRPPQEMTNAVLSSMEDRDGVVFGFGNFSGAGQLLSAHWAEVGKDYGL